MTKPKEKIEEKKKELLKLTKEFSSQFLNKEYEELIEKLINKMARKREVPFLSGRIEIWAAAVIHALGTINFLFDKSAQPFVPVTDILEYFGTKQSTTSQKSKKIRDMFNMNYFDSDFSIKSIIQDSPFNDLSILNGLYVSQDIFDDPQVEIEEWEIQAAQILGISGLETGKEYKVSYMEKLFIVKETSLMSFYQYLMEQMIFPFTAIYEEEVGPSEIAEIEVNCIRLDQEMKVDENYGVLVECSLGSEKIILPLASFKLDEGHKNFRWIDLYQEWFWSYR
ncbi:DUF6398 domain-containing protein [Bacillus sp. MUM 13]|uniref:DUF6398 domain-containing protein n=1 Tax=Bacillus sp. MUM 13 TaxID=1678001 RepID=UPI0011133175|nr:DUF6398 domain-containing protein [Bacillus sp. MUM 13]